MRAKEGRRVSAHTRYVLAEAQAILDRARGGYWPRGSMVIRSSSSSTDGNIARAMYGVKPEGNAEEVLEALPG